MTVSELFKSDVIIASLHLTSCPTSCQPLQQRQANETLRPARFSLELCTKGINVTLYKRSILFMHFYFRPSLLLYVYSLGQTHHSSCSETAEKVATKLLPCGFGDVRI